VKLHANRNPSNATAPSHTLADFCWLSVNLVAKVFRQSSLIQVPRLTGRGYFFAQKKLIVDRRQALD